MLGIKQKKNLLGILELQWHKYSDFAFNIIFMIIFNSRKTNKQQQKQLLGMVLWQAFFNTSLRVQNWIRIRLTSLKKAWSLVVWGYLSPQVQWDNYFHKMEKAMAPHSSTLAWRILWMEEPGRLQSMGSRRVGHDWATSLSLFTFMHWRRKWRPTPVFLLGESQGWRSLAGCCLWGRTESDTTEAT